MSKSIFVVMANDVVDCVFDVEWKAEIYCLFQNQWQSKEASFGGRIYYRHYEFGLNLPGVLFRRAKGNGLDTHDPTPKEQEEFRESLQAAWAERQRAAGASA